MVSYEYRADGMRTRKLAVGTGQQEILYLHDGQNPIEEATFSNGPTRGAYTEIVRNGLGARGIDYVEVFKTGSATSVRFPVYDGHGNMTACLLRDGAGGFTLTSRRAYDPWGAMRQWGTHPSGASAYQGAPSNRYVGSLGHQQDDDSGLYYMRARYYEPGSGRFISEDPARDKLNWFSYCGNDPVNNVDASGKDFSSFWGMFVAAASAWVIKMAAKGGKATPAQQWNAILAGIAGYFAAKAGGAATEALSLGTTTSLAAHGVGMTVGGFLNGLATLFINMLTGEETDAGDFFLAMFCGAIGSGASYGLDSASGTEAAKDMTLGLFSAGFSELRGAM